MNKIVFGKPFLLYHSAHSPQPCFHLKAGGKQGGSRAARVGQNTYIYIYTHMLLSACEGLTRAP